MKIIASEQGRGEWERDRKTEVVRRWDGQKYVSTGQEEKGRPA